MRSQSSRSLSPPPPRVLVTVSRPAGRFDPTYFPGRLRATAEPPNRGKRISYRIRWKTMKKQIKYGLNPLSVIVTKHHTTEVYRQQYSRIAISPNEAITVAIDSRPVSYRLKFNILTKRILLKNFKLHSWSWVKLNHRLLGKKFNWL